MLVKEEIPVCPRRWLPGLFAWMLGLVLLLPSPSAAATSAAGPVVPADIRAAILYNPSSQQVLWSRNAQQPLYPASLTKLLTALVVVRHAANLDSVTQVSQTAARQEPVDLVMKPGTPVTLREMLYGAMLPSANDAAYVLAEAVGGSAPAFAAMMNETAAQLGATHSHFVTPNGLHDPKHVATAADLARITAAALADPTLQQIVRTPTYTLDLEGQKKTLRNISLLQAEGFVGGKSGFTDQAGWCYAGEVIRDGMPMVAVVLHAQSDKEAKEAVQALWSWGSAQFTPSQPLPPGAALPIADRPGWVAQAKTPFFLSLPRGHQATWVPNWNFPDPLKDGDRIGSLQFMIDGKAVPATLPLYAHWLGESTAVESMGAKTPVLLSENAKTGLWWQIGGGIFLIACVALGLFLRRRRNRHKHEIREIYGISYRGPRP